MKPYKYILAVCLILLVALCGCTEENNASIATEKSKGTIDTTHMDIESSAPVNTVEYKVEIFKDLGGGMLHGIAFDDTGHMYVGREGGKILMLTPDGSMTEFADIGNFPEISDKAGLDNMTVDRQGNLYAAGGDRIIRITGDGKISTVAVLKQEAYNREFEAGVNDVKYNNNGYLYTVHTGNTVCAISPASQIVNVIKPGDPEILLEGMIGFDFNKDCSKIYITGMGSGSLGIFPLDESGCMDTDHAVYSGNIPRSHYVAVDENGDAFVTSEDMLVKVSEDGMVTRLNLSGEFKQPNTLAFGRKGFDESSLYVTTFDGKILKVDIGVKAARAPIEPSQTDAVKLEWKEVTPAAAFPARSSHQAVVFKDKIWVFGGAGVDKIHKDVWNSSDGKDWKRVVSNLEFYSGRGASFVFDDKIWFFSDNGDTMQHEAWNSTDGIKWLKVDVPGDPLQRFGRKVITYNNMLWSFGGWNNSHFNDVWNSSDGMLWTNVTQNAEFSQRSDYGTTVFKDKIWIIAGQGGANTNDVWSSTDGIKWMQATPDGKFQKRHCAETVVYDGKMWLIGGFAGDIMSDHFTNDTWYSTDGVEWTELDTPVKFCERNEFQAVVFKNKLWVIGGRTGNMDNGSLLNDVWCLE